jgi:hypothetical protein
VSRILQMAALALALASCATSAIDRVQAASDPVPRVSVIFVMPETFTDAGYSKTERSSPAILLQLQRFIVETATRQLPEPLRLDIKIIDVDLAGDFELFRGPQFEHVRIIKDIYPPRIVLEFRVSDPVGRSINEGRHELADLNYLVRVTSRRDDPLRYEKELLQGWFDHDLPFLGVEKTN